MGNHNQKNKKISDIFLIEGKAYNNSIINQEYIIKNNDDLNDSTKLNNKNYMSKLKLNSNHTPIEPMSFENENNRIIKSKYELIFFKPLLSKCYISKVDKAFNKAIHKVRNKDYIFKNGSHPNCITNLFINNASNETKKIHDKKKSFSQKYILSRMNKYKKISKNHSKSKSNLLNPKRNINDEKNIFFLKKKKKKIINKKMKNKYISEKAKSKKLFNSPSSKLLNNRNHSTEKLKLFFKVNETNNDKSTINYSLNKDINARNYQIKESIRNKENFENFPLFFEKMKKNQNGNIIKIFNNNEKKLNKKLLDYCRKEEIKKLKINNINRNDFENSNIFKECSKTCRIKNTFGIQKSFSRLKINNNNLTLKKYSNLIDYFVNDDSIILNTKNNYNHIINYEFPAINSYFHRIKK